MGVSAALAGVILLTSGTMVNEHKIDPIEVSVADVYFDETCDNGKFVMIYHETKGVVYDSFVKNKEHKKRLDQLLETSDYLMSDRITDYYILHD